MYWAGLRGFWRKKHVGTREGRWELGNICHITLFKASCARIGYVAGNKYFALLCSKQNSKHTRTAKSQVLNLTIQT